MRLHENTNNMKNWSFDVSFPPRKVAPESEVKEAKSVIKACIMAYKGGIPVNSLREEYKKITGEEIPYLKLGYNSLFHFLRDIPDIRNGRTDSGEPVLVVQANEKTKHIQDLVKQQKDPKTVRSRTTNTRDKRRNSIREKRNQSRKKNTDEQRNIDISSSSNYSVPVDEKWYNPMIYNEYNFEDKISECSTPIVGSSQLMGDDYFLQLCIKYLYEPLLRRDSKSAITCGTVQSGLTIRKATKRLDKINTMSNKLVINVGTVDVYNRRTENEMITDYKALLVKLKRKYGYSNSQITLCTLPPMANVALFCEHSKYMTHSSFNNWLRDYATTENYKLLDLHQEFVDDSMIIDYNLFQQNARMVSGTMHPHVLFNYFGRQKAMHLLASV